MRRTMKHPRDPSPLQLMVCGSPKPVRQQNTGMQTHRAFQHASGATARTRANRKTTPAYYCTSQTSDRFPQGKEVRPNKVNIDCSKPLEGPQTNNVLEPQKARLFRSTSACMLPSGRPSLTERRHDTFPTSDKSFKKRVTSRPSQEFFFGGTLCEHWDFLSRFKCCRRALQKWPPHVHIHVSHGTSARKSNTLQHNSINGETDHVPTCTERNTTVSLSSISKWKIRVHLFSTSVLSCTFKHAKLKSVSVNSGLP